MCSVEEISARYFDVYLALASRLQGATATELAEATGMPAGEIEGCLESLSGLHLVEEDPQYAWRYRLGARGTQLGCAGRYVQMRDLAWPHLQHLHEITRHKASLHIVDGHMQRAIDICPRQSQHELRRKPEVGYRNGRILRFGATAAAILAFLPDAEAARALGSSAEPPSPDQIRSDPQFAHLADVKVDREYWDKHSPTLEYLCAVRRRGFAQSSAGIGQAMTAPLFERGARVCGAVCLFGEAAGEAPSPSDAQFLLATGDRISAALGFLGEYPGLNQAG